MLKKNKDNVGVACINFQKLKCKTLCDFKSCFIDNGCFVLLNQVVSIMFAFKMTCSSATEHINGKTKGLQAQIRNLNKQESDE